MATELTKLLTQCVLSNTTGEWTDLLSFPHVVLSTVSQKYPRKLSLTQKIRKNLELWISGARTTTLRTVPRPNVQPKPQDPEFRVARQIEAKLADFDIRGAIRILASSEGIAPFSQETFSALKEKHPLATYDLEYPEPPNTPTLFVESEEVAKAVASFPNGSGGGPDGLRPQHLKDLTTEKTGAAGACLLEALTDVVNHILAGKIPEDILPFLYGASLVALEKKDGGVRPIAIGCTIRRIVGKVACRAVSDELGNVLRPHQLGFATPCGTEAIVHTFRRVISSKKPGLILKLDFANAFNTVLRSKVLDVARKYVPSLYPTILQAYGKPSHLLFGEEVIQSTEGLQQGDPLAPPLFCLVINALVLSLQSPLNCWYLDDGTLAGPGYKVLQDLISIQNATADVGLCLNPEKCELYVTGEEDQEAVDAIKSLLPGIRVLEAPDCMLLGAPLTDEALPSALLKKTDKVKLLVDRLSILQPHTALFILKNSLSIPRLVHLLRCSPTWKVPNLLEKFDIVMRSGLEKITNVSIDDKSWAQSSLPVNRGGLGIRSACKLSVPAFLASLACTKDLISLIAGSSSLITDTDPDNDAALESWHALTDSAEVPDSNRQRDWEAPVLDKLTMSMLKEASTPMEKARLLAASRKESGAWLNALPCPSLGLVLDDSSLRIAVGLRLGTPLCHPHTCVCGEHVDHLGTHGLSCVKKGGTFSRHSALNELIKQACSKVNVPTLLEPPGLFRTDGKRADGLTLRPWSKGKCLVWDATCADTLCKSYISLTSLSSGAAAAKAEKKKKDLYAELPKQYLFCPFAVETLGSFGEEALQLVRELGGRLRATTGDSRETSWLFQRISVAIQRGNSASILATIPSTSKARTHDDVYF
jgi:hypothetical protein